MSLADLELWIGQYRDRHRAQDDGCTCGWDPKEYTSDWEGEAPTHQDHLDASFADELVDVLPSGTYDYVDSSSMDVQQKSFGELVDQHIDCPDWEIEVINAKSSCKAWVWHVRRMIEQCLAYDDPAETIRLLRLFVAGLEGAPHGGESLSETLIRMRREVRE